MRLYIKVTGAEALSRAFGNVTPEIEKALREVVRASTIEVANGARQRVHVKSGEVKSTIREEFSQNGLVGFVRVGYGTLKRRSRSKVKRRRSVRTPDSQAPGVYAMVLEFGSKHQNRPPHPFLFPALDAARPNFERRAQEALEPALQEAVRAAGADK